MRCNISQLKADSTKRHKMQNKQNKQKNIKKRTPLFVYSHLARIEKKSSFWHINVDYFRILDKNNFLAILTIHEEFRLSIKTIFYRFS